MSRRTTSEFSRDPCPCGAGEVITTIHENDNMYSGDDWEFSVTCPACDKLKAGGPRGRYVITRIDPVSGIPEVFEYPVPAKK